jgi:hypothetical protein
MTIVRPDREGALEHGLDLGDRDAMLLAFLAVECKRCFGTLVAVAG